MPEIPEINQTLPAAQTSAAAPSNTSPAAASSAASLSTAAQSEDDMQALEINASDPVSIIESQSALTQQMYQLQIEQCKKEIANVQREMQELESDRRSLLTQMCDDDVDTSQIVSEFNKLGNSKIKLYSQLRSITAEISSIQLKMQQDILSARSSIAEINALAQQSASLNSSYQNGLANVQSINTSSGVGDVAVQMGLSFVGVINSDAQGNAEFSPGGASQHWCADFVTSITKRAYEAKGLEVPSGFGSSAVSGLQSWGKSKGVYLDTASDSNKASAIAASVKPGDIMIQKRNGASHTGIVTKVYEDGSFDTVEGNSSDAVKTRHYDASSSVLSGFVLMSRL